MSKKKAKNKKIEEELEEEPKKSRKSKSMPAETQKGIVIVVLFALAAISLLSMFDLAGQIGNKLDSVLMYVFGYGKYILPVFLIIIGYLLIYPEKYRITIANYLGIGLFTLSFLAFLNSLDGDQSAGGRLGMVLSYPLLKISSVWVAWVVIIALGVTSLLLMFNTSLAAMLNKFPATSFLGKIGQFILHLFGRAKDGISSIREKSEYEEYEEVNEEGEENPSFNQREIADNGTEESGKPKQMELVPPKRQHRHIAIPLELLNNKNEKPTSGDINKNKEVIHHTLASFGIETTLGDVSVGPTVTQYTLKPSEGVKLAQITTLSNDLSLALAAHPIRIEAPIPGKSLVGIEVPNESVAMVGLKEIFKMPEFKKRKNNLTLCLGRDVAGKSYQADLDTMPHLLIAGATGSGKSVCINTIIMSLLFQNGPDDLKLILVDPKRVEFTLYNGIPHLLTPVITDVTKTINALKWIVNEMDRRYELLSQSGKRNIHDYIKNGGEMPYIVLVIDELADLMSVSAREVEAAITRLAQMARAVGIHLVLATQRPSVDVITGLIKANITSRVAFNVASLIDSRTILDHSGAEKLLGKGDMLYISASLAKPKRLQGAFLTEEEISRVVGYLKNKAKPEYTEEVTEKPAHANSSYVYQDGEAEDELLEEAKQIILQAKKASASLLQRRLRVGYARAARILDILEEQGFIGPADGAKPREILVSGAADETPEESEKEEEEQAPAEAAEAEEKEEEPEEEIEQPKA
ncbi:MAG: DNA translocase FtsK 4TM domain-containing protein [Patescibacteria group bacterium]|jgi:S-DNA-T family DNA segregation ATPase FtsK/SpoIIIE